MAKICASNRYCTRVAGLDFLTCFDLFLGHFQGVADMGAGVGLVALLLGDARDILGVEALQSRQAEAVEQDAGQHEGAGPKNIFHQHPDSAWMP